MRDNIINLHGEAMGPQDAPWPEVVKECERLLEMARAGEIQGIAAVVAHRDLCITDILAGRFGPTTIGGLELLKARMLDVILGK